MAEYPDELSLKKVPWVVVALVSYIVSDLLEGKWPEALSYNVNIISL